MILLALVYSDTGLPTSNSRHQPENQQDDSNHKQNPEERACQKAYRKTQHPQNQEDNTDYQEQT